MLSKQVNGLTMDSMEEYYEKYHKDGAGVSDFVKNKSIALGNLDKAVFVERYLKGKILDVGCGSGFDVNYFHEKGFDIAGNDISGTAIEKAMEAYPKSSFFVHDFTSSPLDAKYETINCFSVIEHILDYKTFLSNIYASLKTGGNLIISTPNIFGLLSYVRLLRQDGKVFGLRTRDESHIRFFSVGTLKETLVEMGFKIIKIKTFSTYRIPLPNGWGGDIVVVCEKL